MNLDQVEHVLSEIARAAGISEFVVIGSLSVLGISGGRQDIPDRMLLSNEVDAYPEFDPGRATEFTAGWGQGSDFERKHGYYFDAVSPDLPTLPDGWKERLTTLRLKSGITVKFLDSNDAAISKYARGEPKDRQWIRDGIRASILSIAVIDYRMRETLFLSAEEHGRVKAALEEDRAWFEKLVGPSARATKKRPGRSS